MLLTVLGIAPGPAAHGLTINVNCPGGNTTATYDPGIRRMTPHCSCPGRRHLRRPRALLQTRSSNTAPTDSTQHCLSCEQPFFSAPGTTVIEWNNGKQRALSVNGVVTTNGGQMVDTFTGTVTAGEFTGASVVAVLTDVQTKRPRMRLSAGREQRSRDHHRANLHSITLGCPGGADCSSLDCDAQAPRSSKKTAVSLSKMGWSRRSLIRATYCGSTS